MSLRAVSTNDALLHTALCPFIEATMDDGQAKFDFCCTLYWLTNGVNRYALSSRDDMTHDP